MDSLWLCRDAEVTRPARRSRAQQRRAGSSDVQARVFGIFTEQPAEIARRIPRPLTPFVPAPTETPQKDLFWEVPVSSVPTCDSPPVAFEFGSAGFADVPCGMSIF
jgi:hypothetical protein